MILYCMCAICYDQSVEYLGFRDCYGFLCRYRAQVHILFYTYYVDLHVLYYVYVLYTVQISLYGILCYISRNRNRMIPIVHYTYILYTLTTVLLLYYYCTTTVLLLYYYYIYYTILIIPTNSYSYLVFESDEEDGGGVNTTNISAIRVSTVHCSTLQYTVCSIYMYTIVSSK